MCIFLEQLMRKAHFYTNGPTSSFHGGECIFDHFLHNSKIQRTTFGFEGNNQVCVKREPIRLIVMQFSYGPVTVYWIIHHPKMLIIEYFSRFYIKKGEVGIYRSVIKSKWTLISVRDTH